MHEVEPSCPALHLLAAQHVGLSQSAASLALAKFEQSLGKQWVARQRRDLRLLVVFRSLTVAALKVRLR